MKPHSTAVPMSDTTPKRVCMIANTHYKFDGRVRLEAESLVKWGYEVVFLVPKAQAAPRTYTLEGVTVKELNVAKYNEKNKLRYLLSYITFLALAFVACTRLFFKSNVRVIHVHNMPDVLVFAALIPRLFGCKLVLDLHDTVSETYEAKFGKVSRLVLGMLRLEERICCAFAHRVICVNHVQRDAVIQRGVPGEKIATVITMPKFTSQTPSREAPKQDQVFRMVNHGTMSKRLGNDLIIEAVAKLVQEIPGFELHIIGGGDNLDQLLPLSKSLGVENYVHFHERVPWDKLGEKLSIMDVGIVANRVNVATDLMLPSKLIDYVVLGIPAIVPRLRAIEYYFSPEMVTYFEPENVDSMVAATVSLYRDRARRERQPIKATKFLDENRWDDREKGLRGLYDQLFKGTTPEPRPTSRSDVGIKRLQNNSLANQTRMEDVEVRSLEEV
jgi:glycosyltransferase involved in cell wall biosynthesis